MHNLEQEARIKSGQGFIAALDQSGGSTPKALRLYGIDEDAYGSDSEMFDLIHQMRSRITKAPAFDGGKVIGAILFEMTMDRDMGGKPSAQYLWEDRGVVPFLKVDKGLESEANSVQLMKPMPGLDDVLDRAVDKGIYGTKMRSVVNGANKDGIAAIVAQQFEIGDQILNKGLVPILEPEVNITIADKAESEDILLEEIKAHLDQLPEGRDVMLKLSLPSHDNQYTPLISHPRVQQVVALSGGYSREEACTLLARNTGMIASFSRALSEGLSAKQDEEEFDATLADSIDAIYRASLAG